MDSEITLHTNPDTIRILITAGVEIGTRVCAVLSNVLEKGEKKTARIILESYANDDDVLSRAAMNGYTEIVRFMIECDKNVLNTQNKFGWTPLMEAAVHNRSEVIKLLLDAGADSSIQLSNGSTAYSLAVEAGAKESVKLLR